MSPERFPYEVTLSGSESSVSELTWSSSYPWPLNVTSTDQNLALGGDSLSYDLSIYEDSPFSGIPIIGPIIDWIEAALNYLYTWLVDRFTSVLTGIRDVVNGIMAVVLAPVNTALTWVKDKVLDVWHWLSSTIPAAVEAVRIKVVDIWNWVTSAIPNSLDWLKSHVSSVISSVAAIPGAIADAASNVIKTITRVLSDFFDPVCNQINVLLRGTRSYIADALANNSPEVKKMVLSWWPTGTPFYDFVNAVIKFVLYSPQITFDKVGQLIAFVLGEDYEAWGKRVEGDLATVKDNSVSLPEFINKNVADPILDAIKDLWNKLTGILKAAFDLVWDAIKEFFTVILPNWFRAIWEAIRGAISWVWDKVQDVAGFFLDEILKLVGMHSPISPAGGLGTLKGMINVGLAMAGGLGIMTLAGNLVHPLHSLGLEHVSAMVYDMTNYKLIIGAGMGVIAACSIRIPLTWYFNSILRPNLPSPRDAAMMRSRQYITKEAYRELLGYFGIPNNWHDNLDRLTETRVGYFALAAVARNGVFNKELFDHDLHRAGYAEEMIGLLLNMYEKMANEAVQGMMSGTAVKRFKEGMSTEDQFHGELTLLGYSDQQWPTLLAGARLEYAYDYTSDLISAYRDAVRKGNISLDDYRQALLGIGIVPDKVEAYVLRERARLKPDEKLTPLSPAVPVYETDAGKVQVDTLRRQRRKSTIARDQEIAGLQALGMPVDYARAIADNDDIRLAEKGTAE
jgi:hypothetical protein